MKIRYIPGSVLGPVLYGVDIRHSEAASVWREFLKKRLLRDRLMVCDCGCGERMCLGDGIDMHEGIITRSDTRGLPWRPLIFHEYNCFLVRHDHHLDRPMVRRHFFDLACARYGSDEVLAWLNTLPFKTRIRWAE